MVYTAIKIARVFYALPASLTPAHYSMIGCGRAEAQRTTQSQSFLCSQDGQRRNLLFPSRGKASTKTLPFRTYTRVARSTRLTTSHYIRFLTFLIVRKDGTLLILHCVRVSSRSTNAKSSFLFMPISVYKLSANL